MKIYAPTTIQQVDIVDDTIYAIYKEDLAKFESWRNGRQSYHTSEIPDDLRHIDNDMRSKIEQYEFRHNRPVKYFAYWSKRYVNDSGSYQIWLTTFTGDILAKVVDHKPAYRDNLGGERVNFTALGLNGIWYSGTYYKSAGDYCRIKMLKRNPNTNDLQ